MINMLKENEGNIKEMVKDQELKELKQLILEKMVKYKYSYNFSWLGMPIIQIPDDIISIQELIWRLKPDLIIETGIAHGGGLIFYASLLELIGGNGLVLGIDIEIREHNRNAIKNHPMFKRINMIEGSSTSDETIQKVREICKSCSKILVCLDSNHTHEHVIKELELFSQFVSLGSYIIVYDTIVADLPENFFDDRPWGKENNPKTAVKEFLKLNKDFIIDKEFENKMIFTVAPDGFLKRIK